MSHPEAALVGMVELLCDVVRAQNGFVVIAVRRGHVARRRDDPIEGFRIAHYHRLHPLAPHAAKLIAEVLADGGYVTDVGVQTAVQKTQGVWLARNEPLRRPGRDSDPRLVAFQKALAASDRLLGGVRLGRCASAYFGFERARRRRPFSEADITRGRTLMSALSGPLGRVAAWYGVFDGDALFTPRETEVFRLLLGPHTEKQIAHALGLTERSTHQLVLAVFKKFRASGRAELFRRWLDLSLA